MSDGSKDQAGTVMLRFSASVFLVSVFISLSPPLPLAAAVVTLEWDSNTEPDLKGYILSYGTESGEYTESIIMGQQTRITLGGLQEGTEYFFVLQAYDRAGNESAPSEEISHVVEASGDDDLDLITPNGGERLRTGSRYSIEWEVLPDIEKIRIFVSTDGGVTWDLVKGNTKNDGHWMWSIPDAQSDQCLMKIEEYQNPDVYDISLDFFSIGENVGIDEGQPSARIPRRAELYQNYPNPFNPVTTISFAVPEPVDGSDATSVSLSVFDARGRHVRTLADSSLPAGRHVVSWNGRTEQGEKAPSGVYFSSLRVGKEACDVRKMILAR